MIEELLQQERELERARIITETAKIPWQDLQRYFAGGKVFWTATDIDLVDVACALQQDDTDLVQAWTSKGQLQPVNDDQARSWIAEDRLLWAVVVKPWVLVQEIDDTAE